MRRALELAAAGPWPDPNPRVGAVVVDRHGVVVGEGWHRGAGSPHAEVAALTEAGARARGGSVFVTLEPCAHTGRTGACTEALVAAGVSRVSFSATDPNPVASGGGDALRRAGVAVDGGVLATEAAELNARWSGSLALGRPLVTWKLASTLDGRSAASDGSSRWITGDAARADVHALRATRDAVLVGTGTLLADDPQLTVRMPSGALAARQPVRAVMGLREVPVAARVNDAPGEVLHLPVRSPQAALAQLWRKGIRDVWLEGGPTLAAAFVAAGLVDEVYAYLAPALLGSGVNALGDLGVRGMSDIVRLAPSEVCLVGDDVRIHAVVPAVRGDHRTSGTGGHLEPVTAHP